MKILVTWKAPAATVSIDKLLRRVVIEAAMPRIHPKPEVLDGLIRLITESEDRLLRHVRVCAVCRDRLEAARRPDPGNQGSNVLAWPVAATEHGRAVDLALSGLPDGSRVDHFTYWYTGRPPLHEATVSPPVEGGAAQQ